MNLPNNTTSDGTAFAVKSGERACFATMTQGGGHFPETAVIVVYQCADGMLVNDSRTLPQGWCEQRHRHDVLDAGDGGHRDMGGVRC